MNRSRKIVLYGLYTLAVVFFFLYVRFPSQAVQDYVTKKIHQSYPDIQLITEKVTPVFPFGLKMAPLTLSYSGTPVLRTDFATATVSLSSLFKKNKQIDYSGTIGNGSFKGWTEWSKIEKKSQVKSSLKFMNLAIESVDWVNRWPGYKPWGEMNASLDYDSRKGGTGSATVLIDIAQAGVLLNPALMGLEKIEVAQLQAEMVLTQKMLQIKRCDANGPQMTGKLVGSVMLREPIGSSRLTMSCTIKPEPAFIAEHKTDPIGGLLGSETAQQRGLVFRITGTLDTPNYTTR